MGSSLLKLAKQKKQRELYISNDCLSDILIRLPTVSLRRLQLVCKRWYNVINTTLFADEHLNCSDNVLIYLSLTPPPIQKNKQVNIFSVEDTLAEMDPLSTSMYSYPDMKSYIKYLKIEDGKANVVDYHVSCFGKIKSTCNGLILISNTLRGGGLLVMNPVTRSLLSVPLGTSGEYGCKDLYALAFSPIIKKHKVVHLFRDESVFLGCETIMVGFGESWKSVEGPHTDTMLMLSSQPVFAIGALHWIDRIAYKKLLMSMDIDKEKFQTIALPDSDKEYQYDNILEMRGVLCYVDVGYSGCNQVDIWVLKGLCGEKFIKLGRITTDQITRCFAPFFGSRFSEEIIFERKRDGSLYTYNLEMDEITMVEIPKESTMNAQSLWPCSWLPHVNSLVSWGVMDQFQEF